MKRLHEPLVAESQGLQLLCAAGAAVCICIYGQPRADDLVIGAMAGMCLSSWLAVACKALHPRLLAFILRVGWAIRVDGVEAMIHRAGAIHLRAWHTAERRGYLQAIRRHRALWYYRMCAAVRRCTMSAPAVVVHRSFTLFWTFLGVEDKLRSWRTRRASRRLQQRLVADASLGVTRHRLRAQYASAASPAEDEATDSQCRPLSKRHMFGG